MQKKLTWSDAVVFIVWLLPLIYLLFTYPSLPDRVPVHFNIVGTADRYGSRSEFVGVVLMISAIGLGVALLVRFIPYFDPKKKARYSQQTFTRISHALLLLMTGIAAFIIYTAVKKQFSTPVNVVFALASLFMAYLGNALNNIKPNYFVGIRTPWTLENEEVWRKTHQFAARIWLSGGILLAAFCWIINDPIAHYIFLGCIVFMGLLPVVYSYRYYQRIKKRL